MATTLPTSNPAQDVRDGTHVHGVLVIDERSELLSKIQDKLADGKRLVEVRRIVALEDLLALADQSRGKTDLGIQTVVFSPLRTKRRARVPDVDYANLVIQACKILGICRFVLISSAEVYGAEYSNSGLLPEKADVKRRRSNCTAERWSEIEEAATDAFGQGSGELVILRPCWTLSAGKTDLASRMFDSRVAFPAVGFDASIQLLSTDDLAGSIIAAISSEDTGIYNVAPDHVIPLRAALRLAKTWSIPVPYTMLRWICTARSRQQLEFIRYSWAVSNQKIKDELGFQPRMSSVQALVEFTGQSPGKRKRTASTKDVKDRPYDPFGMDESYIRSCGNWQIGFMEKAYFRVEVDGLEHVPRNGGGVLAGPHRGFMPFDGVMIVHLLLKNIDRIPRFLMHPALVKFPFLATFLTKLGGIMASQENADHVLNSGEMVAVFPEGIRGAFRMYDRGETYRLGKFRDDYVKFALRHGVPIIPFVAVGPAEAFPILAKIEWPWWKRLTHWPFFPITATWPVLPIPLPTKWHIKFLEPITMCNYAPQDADDRKLVSKLSREIRDAMQEAIDEMRRRRKSIFYGSIFKKDLATREVTLDTAEAEPPINVPIEAK